MHRIPSTLGIASLGLALVLSSCGSPSQESASPSSSTASSQSSSAASSAAASSPAASQATPGASTGTKDSAAPAASGSASASVSSPPDTYEGAQEIKDSGRTIAVDAPEVKQSTQLVNTYEKTLGEVKTSPAPTSTTPAEDNPEGSTAERNAPSLDQSTIDAISALSVGAAREEFLMSAVEYAQNGWHYEGQSTVVGTPRIADTTYEGQPAKIMEVCLDSSKVVIKDSNGQVIDTSGSPSRSLNIYTLVSENGVMKIARHDFPNNPDC
ncbi:MAG: hypothetical protein Q4P78_03855 [Rothia sp. (in: high G+C Gram-positive bacteria)]|uniref:hypothetical protein n=1 Tax=Rothia sp. (in: high G+C Gram-positive bacteria) TaxID=1885016 RepID=UPI0026E0FDB7|nr:hypothetical protein [Rothia sp. (in: high G+C Gram-positive bacteria)]MDO5750324.1 hypothetical protein [Rothia sp. (in: high G+C Gram-positive bacteria)]